MAASQHDPVDWTLSPSDRIITIVSFQPTGSSRYLAIYRVTNASSMLVLVAAGTWEDNTLELLPGQSIDVSSATILIGLDNRHNGVASGTYQLLCCALAQGAETTAQGVEVIGDMKAPTLSRPPISKGAKSRRAGAGRSRKR